MRLSEAIAKLYDMQEESIVLERKVLPHIDKMRDIDSHNRSAAILDSKGRWIAVHYNPARDGGLILRSMTPDVDVDLDAEEDDSSHEATMKKLDHAVIG